MPPKRKPLRPCLKCNRPTDGTYCTQHKPKDNRGTRQQRGYTAEYQAAKKLCLQQETHCWICGDPPTKRDPLTADHITPLSLGGTNTRDNLRAAHKSCNSRRGNRLV